MQAYCQRDGTQWKFDVEAASWRGGFFERLVKSVKLSLRKVIRNARLNYDELSTVLVEVEAALNSRPLTYVFDEMEEPLTPSHLTVGRRILSVPLKNSSNKVGQTEGTLTRRANCYSKLWIISGTNGGLSTVTQLREYHPCSKRANSVCKVQVVLCVYMRTKP